MENITEQVGDRVARARTEMGLTQADLADAMSTRLGREIRPLTVTRLEGGKRPIGVDELVAIAAALGIEPADLLSDVRLSSGAVRAAATGQKYVRASDELQDSIRGWQLAHEEVVTILKNAELFGSLPVSTQKWLRAIGEQSLIELVEASSRKTTKPSLPKHRRGAGTPVAAGVSWSPDGSHDELPPERRRSMKEYLDAAVFGIDDDSKT